MTPEKQYLYQESEKKGPTADPNAIKRSGYGTLSAFMRQMNIEKNVDDIVVGGEQIAQVRTEGKRPRITDDAFIKLVKKWNQTKELKLQNANSNTKSAAKLQKQKDASDKFLKNKTVMKRRSRNAVRDLKLEREKEKTLTLQPVEDIIELYRPKEPEEATDFISNFKKKVFSVLRNKKKTDTWETLKPHFKKLREIPLALVELSKSFKKLPENKQTYYKETITDINTKYKHLLEELRNGNTDRATYTGNLLGQIKYVQTNMDFIHSKTGNIATQAKSQPKQKKILITGEPKKQKENFTKKLATILTSFLELPSPESFNSYVTTDVSQENLAIGTLIRQYGEKFQLTKQIIQKETGFSKARSDLFQKGFLTARIDAIKTLEDSILALTKKVQEIIPPTKQEAPTKLELIA